MRRKIVFIVGLICPCLWIQVASGQSPNQLRRDRLRGSLNNLDNRIGEQRVQRQTEVLRLEEQLRAAEDRITRLERQARLAASAPTITLPEAEAVVAFAAAQLKESEKLHGEGKVSDVTLARHRLENIRAQGQLEATKFAHADRLIALEMEVLYAERHLHDLNENHRQLERFVAKGYTTTAGLKRSEYERGLGEKQLELARLRLTAQQQSADLKEVSITLKPRASNSAASVPAAALPRDSDTNPTTPPAPPKSGS